MINILTNLEKTTRYVREIVLISVTKIGRRNENKRNKNKVPECVSQAKFKVIYLLLQSHFFQNNVVCL